MSGMSFQPLHAATTYALGSPGSLRPLGIPLQTGRRLERALAAAKGGNPDVFLSDRGLIGAAQRIVAEGGWCSGHREAPSTLRLLRRAAAGGSLPGTHSIHPARANRPGRATGEPANLRRQADAVEAEAGRFRERHPGKPFVYRKRREIFRYERWSGGGTYSQGLDRDRAVALRDLLRERGHRASLRAIVHDFPIPGRSWESEIVQAGYDLVLTSRN